MTRNIFMVLLLILLTACAAPITQKAEMIVLVHDITQGQAIYIDHHADKQVGLTKLEMKDTSGSTYEAWLTKDKTGLIMGSVYPANPNNNSGGLVSPSSTLPRAQPSFLAPPVYPGVPPVNAIPVIEEAKSTPDISPEAGMVLAAKAPGVALVVSTTPLPKSVYFFSDPDCPHCKATKIIIEKYNDELAAAGIQITMFPIMLNPSQASLLRAAAMLEASPSIESSEDAQKGTILLSRLLVGLSPTVSVGAPAFLFKSENGPEFITGGFSNHKELQSLINTVR